MGDSVVPVVSVTPVVTIEVVTHVNEFLGDDDLECVRQIEGDSLQINQDGVAARPPNQTVRTPIGGGNATPDPPCIRGSTGSDPELVRRQGKQLDIAIDDRRGSIVAVVPIQESRPLVGSGHPSAVSGQSTMATHARLCAVDAIVDRPHGT